MFAKSIVLSDVFLDMPMSARCLYFTLGMFADDDGFVGSPKAIMRQCGSSQDDLLVLLQKRYVLAFKSGVIVIKHWRMNNYLQNDRKKKTTYLEEMAMLEIDDKGAYTERSPDERLNENVYTECIQSSDTMYTECIQDVYTGKDSIGKSNKDTVSSLRSDTMSDKSDVYDTIVDMWNELDGVGNIKGIRGINKGSKRRDMVRARLKQYSMADFATAIENIKGSDFLQGKNNKGWTVTFDWFVSPNNFVKVLEGNYSNKEGVSITGNSYMDRVANRINEVDEWLERRHANDGQGI